MHPDPENPNATPEPAVDAAAADEVGRHLHPRLDMQGPQVGRLGQRKLPDLGRLPYDDPGPAVRERVRPVLVAAAVGGLATATVLGAVAFDGGIDHPWGSPSDDVARSQDRPSPGRSTPGDPAPSMPALDRDREVLGRPTDPGSSGTASPSPTTAIPPTTAPPVASPMPPAATPDLGAPGGPSGGAGAPGPATALVPQEVWFTGGQLVLEGSVPDQRIADALVRKAATIVGEGAVVDRFTIDPMAPIPDGLPVRVAEQVRFGFDSSAVDAEFLALVEAWKQVLDAHPGVRMRVTGHTDSTGSSAYNDALSVERAAAVAGWMEANGIDPGRLQVSGRGAADPLASNDTAEGRAANRRIEVQLEGLLMA